MVNDYIEYSSNRVVMVDDDEASMHSIELTPSFPSTPQNVNKIDYFETHIITANKIIVAPETTTSSLNKPLTNIMNLLPPPPPPPYYSPPPSNTHNTTAINNHDQQPPISSMVLQPRKHPQQRLSSLQQQAREHLHQSRREQLHQHQHQQRQQLQYEAGISNSYTGTTLTTCESSNNSIAVDSSYTYSSQSPSTVVTSTQHTATAAEEEQEVDFVVGEGYHQGENEAKITQHGDASLDAGGELISISSASYPSAIDHVFVGQDTSLVVTGKVNHRDSPSNSSGSSRDSSISNFKEKETDKYSKSKNCTTMERIKQRAAHKKVHRGSRRSNTTTTTTTASKNNSSGGSSSSHNNSSNSDSSSGNGTSNKKSGNVAGTSSRRASRMVDSTMERIKQRSQSGNNQRWRTKSKKKREQQLLQQNQHQQEQVGVDKETPLVSNRKQYHNDSAADEDELVTTANSPISNLFLQMSDHEVGNHSNTNTTTTIDPHNNNSSSSSFLKKSGPTTTTTEEGYFSVTTNSTAPDSSSSFNSHPKHQHQQNHHQEMISALGSAATGLRFHPHTGIGNVESFGGETEEDEDDEDDDYYPTPIRGTRHLKQQKEGVAVDNAAFDPFDHHNGGSSSNIGDTANNQVRTPEKSKKSKKKKNNKSQNKKRPPKPLPATTSNTTKSSPQSVMEGVATLTSFPRYKQLSKKAMDNKKAALAAAGGCAPLRHDSSYDDSTMEEGTNEDVSLLSDDDEDDDDALRGLQRALFHTPLNKVHEFITGNMLCWSTGDGKQGLIGRIQEGCADTTTSMDAHLDGVEDYDYEEEEETLSEEVVSDYYYSEDDGGLTSGAEESSSASIAGDVGKKNKKPTTASGKNKKGSKKQMKKKTSSRSSQPRRGRSPTAKPGYNSDGESIRNSSHSRSRGSPRSSNSLSLSTRGTAASVGGGVRQQRVYHNTGNASINEYGYESHGGVSSPTTTGRQEIVDPSGRRGSSIDHHQNGSAAGRNDPPSVVAEESVAESVLSQDGAAWRAMTVQQQQHHQQQQSSSVSSTRSTSGVMGGVEARDEVDDENLSGEAPTSLVATGVSSSPYREANSIEGYFKKLLTVGIQLLFNDPPHTFETQHLGPRLHRTGKMFLQFGNITDGTCSEFEHPRLVWTDGQTVSHALELLDIVSIHSPDPFELEDKEGSSSHYPFAIPHHSFFVSTHSGTSLLFEAVDEVQMIRITTALRGIVRRLAKKIVMGENDWVVQMMIASTAGGDGRSSNSMEGFGQFGEIMHQEQQRSLDQILEEDVPYAMADVTDHLVRKQTTGLMRQAQERRSRLRSTRKEHEHHLQLLG